VGECARERESGESGLGAGEGEGEWVVASVCHDA
jgi:hypothetical protein